MSVARILTRFGQFLIRRNCEISVRSCKGLLASSSRRVACYPDCSCLLFLKVKKVGEKNFLKRRLALCHPLFEDVTVPSFVRLPTALLSIHFWLKLDDYEEC
ncbi:hypothetical protein K1719_015005 [Acacia pycnantha]|nr:hypothetical protein K1719_015005 [Acacia pycnantha]